MTGVIRIEILQDKKGFSLVELITVVAMLGIIAAIAVPQFGGLVDSSKEVLVNEAAERLNNGLKKHGHASYQFRLKADDSVAADEIAIIRSLQWRDPRDPVPGSPFIRQDWHPVASSDVADYRLRWSGGGFVVLWPGESGVGVCVKFDGSDYGSNYNFTGGFRPIGG